MGIIKIPPTIPADFLQQLSDINSQLDTILNPVPVTVIDNTDAGFSFTGTWTHSSDILFYNSTKSTSNVSGSYSTRSFYGTGVNIYDSIGPNRGIVEIFIDGVSKGTFDRYTAAYAYKQRVYSIKNLTRGYHTIKSVVTGTKNTSSTDYYFALDYIEVSDVDSISVIRDKVSFLDQLKLKFAYGAKGDGVTDDTAAFQSYTNDLSNLPNGGILYMPAGIFVTKQALTWAPKVSLLGVGIGKSIIKGVGSNFGLIQYSDDTGQNAKDNPITDCFFEKVEFDCSGVAQSGGYSPSYKGIFIQYLIRCTFRDLYIHDSIGTGLGIDYLSHCTIDNVIVKNCGRTYTGVEPGCSGIGIGTGHFTDESVTIINCRTINCGQYGIFFENQRIFGSKPPYYDVYKFIISNCTIVDGKNYGIGVKGTHEVTITDNIIKGNAKTGIIVHKDNSKTIKIMDNQIKDNGDYGVAFQAYNGCLFNDIEIDGNTIEGNQHDGIGILGLSDVDDYTILDGLKILNNTIKNNLYGGVAFRDLVDGDGKFSNVKNIKISGNTIQGNNQTAVGGSPTINQDNAGVLFELNTSNLNISNNDIINNQEGIKIRSAKMRNMSILNNPIYDDQATKTQNRAIYISSATTVTKGRIEMNDTRDNMTPGVTNNSTTSTNLVVNNNL